MKITPLKHQGKADIVRVEESSLSGKLSFFFQREKYEVIDNAEELREKLAQVRSFCASGLLVLVYVANVFWCRGSSLRQAK